MGAIVPVIRRTVENGNDMEWTCSHNEKNSGKVETIVIKFSP